MTVRKKLEKKLRSEMPAIVWVVPHDYRPDLGDNAFDNFAAFHTAGKAEDYRSHARCPEPIAYARLTRKAAEALRATSAAQALTDWVAKKPTAKQLAARKRLLKTGKV